MPSSIDAEAPQTTTPTTRPSSELNCFKRQWRNQPQSNSVGAAAFIFIAGGINMAWGIGFTKYAVSEIHIKIAWFIGAIVGAFLGALLNNAFKSNRKYLYLISEILIFIDGAISFFLSSYYAPIVAAYYIDGIAVGLVFVPTILLIGEESISCMRGRFAVSIELMSFFLGACINIFFAVMFSLNIFMIQGIFKMCAAILGVITTFCGYVESPIYHLKLNDESQALESLRKLQNPRVITTETHDMLESAKEYVAVNEAMPRGSGAVQGLPVLLMLVFYRVVLAMSFSTVTVGAITFASMFAHLSFNWSYMLIIYGVILYIGSFIGMFTIDSWGRRVPSLSIVLLCALLSIPIAIFFNTINNVLEYKKMLAALIMISLYQFGTGWHTATSTAYLTEAFPMSVKPYYIAIPFAVQMLVHIVIISCKTILITNYYYVLAAFNLLLFVLIVMAPETKRLTLIQAQNALCSTPLYGNR